MFYADKIGRIANSIDNQFSRNSTVHGIKVAIRHKQMHNNGDTYLGGFNLLYLPISEQRIEDT